MLDSEKGEDLDSKRSARPTTARRRPPKVKEGAKEVLSKDVAPAAKKAQGIIRDGDDDDVSGTATDEPCSIIALLRCAPV